MFTLTQGPPTDQQVLVAWGIALYLVLAPIGLLVGAVVGRIMRANRQDEPVGGESETEAAEMLHLPVPRGDRPAVAPPAAADIGAAI